MTAEVKTATNSPAPNDKPKTSKGGRNLILLGVGAIVIAFTTTFVALKIYHDSGDIYLDRSRPGFLPEKEEAEAEKDPQDFEFKDSGIITSDVLNEYLDNLKQEINRLNDFSSEPFTPAPLSDKALGF
ncbi:hypothetical protein IJG96_00420 [Candidatus Saccharibacteria bacterium]|nr:hypothetical protein [Candidatus Saccharibacteria bacterium]